MTLAVALWMVLALAGCASLSNESDATNERGTTKAAEPTGTYRVTGAVTYRERIALPPKSVVTVTLEDISVADRAAETLAEQTIPAGRHQVPIKFVLDVDSADLQHNHRYAVRAAIRDANGRLLWTTDTVHSVDPTQSGADLGALVLVRINRS
ncbi:putative lipoprotein [Marinobacter mobilis]|uniref:Putative lipoprotein n=2 Tax=Marinobacter mobilis TaxID=488533 RepID=A0A1H2Q8G2_9GAMM|nr:putative lipoprotein [Marinobacter mobilis]